MPPDDPESIFPKESLFLVTGATGYIGSHVADQLLRLGYRVRGTARSQEAARVVKEYFDRNYAGRYETAIVPELSEPGAYSDAVKGVVGIAHIASDVTLGSDREAIVTRVKDGARHLLETAKENGVKRVVLTVSTAAARTGGPGNKDRPTNPSTWNEEALAESKISPNGLNVYAAAKIESERLAWDFAARQDCPFTLTTILNNLTIGRPINPAKASTGGLIPALMSGNLEPFSFTPEGFSAQWFVDVQDVAKLHVLGLISPHIGNERILAAAAPFNWQQIVAILKELSPNSPIPLDFKLGEDDDGMIDSARGAQLLADGFGQKGWTSLEETVKANVAHLLQQ